LLDGQSRMRVVLEPTVEVVVIEGVVTVGAAVIDPKVVLFEALLDPADAVLPVDVVLPVEVIFFFDARLPPTPPPTATPVMMKITTATRI
jgi:hypothetical protein